MMYRLTATVTVVSMLLCCVIATAGSPKVTGFAEEITPAYSVSYTASATLTAAIDAVMQGDCGLYLSADGAVKAEGLTVTATMNNSQRYYAITPSGQATWGYQCYIYGQGVYATLFNELPYHGAAETRYVHSTQVMGHTPTVSYAQMLDCRVMPGAYVRTTSNADGSYNGSDGHSMIILGYDESGITVLEGNADGKGAITCGKMDWERFNQRFLTGKSRYISHIIQPIETYYAEHYGLSYEMFEEAPAVTLPERMVFRRPGGVYQLLTVEDNLSWTSSDESVATVTQDGAVTVVDNGEATITASSQTNTYEYLVTVDVIPWEKLGCIDAEAGVTGSDATLMLRHYTLSMVGLDGTLTEEQQLLADIDEDGQITAADASYVSRFYVEQFILGNPADAQTLWQIVLGA